MGIHRTVRWAAKRWLPYPLEYVEAGRGGGIGKMVLVSPEIRFPDAHIEAEIAAMKLGLGSLRTELRGVRITGQRGLAKDVLIDFERASIVTIWGLRSTEIRFTNWTSPQLRFEGDAKLDAKGNITSADFRGEADLHLLGKIFSKDTSGSAASASLAPFAIRYGEGMFEVDVNSKPWLRSRWTMRR